MTPIDIRPEEARDLLAIDARELAARISSSSDRLTAKDAKRLIARMEMLSSFIRD